MIHMLANQIFKPLYQKKMIRPTRFIELLEPYSITAQDVWSDIAPTNLLKIDWNEAPVELSFYQEELKKIASDQGIIAWYPDYLALNLTDALSVFVSVSSNNILTFPGSDVGLETLCRTYLNPKDVVVALCPTYENFFVYVTQMGAELRKFQLDGPFEIDDHQIISDLESIGNVRMFYLATPNNPCGYTVPMKFIRMLAEQFPQTIFVVDEAYIEFSDSDSAAPLVTRFSNIVVFRTFSKAFGMAGLRLGYMCASLDIINNVNKIRNGKNVSMIAQRLGLCAIENFNLVDEWIQKIIISRIKFQKWCKTQNIDFYPSQGNFVLFRVSRPNELCSELKAQGIYVRNRDSIISGCVRVTIGTENQVARLISALEKMRNLL